jgi:hypothetical protein
MYRGLTGFGSHNTYDIALSAVLISVHIYYSVQSSRQSFMASRSKGASSGSTTLKPVEVAVHTHSEQYPGSGKSPSGFYIIKGGQPHSCDKVQGLVGNNVMESIEETRTGVAN